MTFNSNKQDVSPQSYGKAMNRLKEIMAALESGTIEIDDLEETIRESDLLLQFCEAKLRGIEDRIEDESE